MILAPSTGDAPTDRWVTGDIFGRRIPADGPALLEGGAAWLTEAFRACGSLGADNRVTEIVAAESFVGGGTGTKQVLTVAYDQPADHLPERLFVKFSRNFDDDLRDRGRFMMVSETHVAVLSRAPGFPVPVPRCLFADIEASSATGLLVTETIPYGHDGVEPLYPKCMDHLVPDAPAHYRAILRGLARVSGTHLAGGLTPDFDERLPLDPAMASAAFGIHVPADTLVRWAERMFDFIAAHPHLFPDELHDPALRPRFLADIPEVVAANERVRSTLADGAVVAFAHWNANIDNCWFERDDDGELVAGFIDWANAGPTDVAQSVLGALSGASIDLWRNHLDDLLGVYVDEFAAQGATPPTLDDLRRRVLVMTACSGLGFSMGAPVAIAREIDDIGALDGPRDEAFTQAENARIQLHMMTSMLQKWTTFDLGGLLRSLGA